MIIYITAVFVFLIIRFSVTLFNFISNPKIPVSNKIFNYKVSILIPARNEAENILALLQSIKEQDYLNYEVIVLDDNSNDETFKICADFSSENEKFSVFKSGELELGWLGKNFACHQLSNLATGDYFLFIDADEVVKPKLISSLIHRLKVEKLALLSLFTNQITKTMGERLTVPMMHFVLLNLLPLRLVKLSSNPAFAAASGQCMFFDAEIYKREMWHKQVKDKIVEDVEILKQVKLLKYKSEALLANHLIYCRMYKSWEEGIQGFSKNLLSGFNNNIIILLVFLALIVAGPLVLLVEFDVELFLLYTSIVILGRIMISYLSNQNVWMNVILHPLQILSFVIISIISIAKHIFKLGTWKGRSIKKV